MTSTSVITTVQLTIKPSTQMKRPFSVMLSVSAPEKLTDNEQEMVSTACQPWIEAKFVDWILRPRPTEETLKLFKSELDKKLGHLIPEAGFGDITVRGYFLSEAAIVDLLREYWPKAA